MTNNDCNVLPVAISPDVTTSHDVARALEAHIYAQGFHDGLRQALSVATPTTPLPIIEA
jgi:hypothetical protein